MHWCTAYSLIACFRHLIWDLATASAPRISMALLGAASMDRTGQLCSGMPLAFVLGAPMCHPVCHARVCRAFACAMLHRQCGRPPAAHSGQPPALSLSSSQPFTFVHHYASLLVSQFRMENSEDKNTFKQDIITSQVLKQTSGCQSAPSWAPRSSVRRRTPYFFLASVALPASAPLAGSAAASVGCFLAGLALRGGWVGERGDV